MGNTCQCCERRSADVDKWCSYCQPHIVNEKDYFDRHGVEYPEKRRLDGALKGRWARWKEWRDNHREPMTDRAYIERAIAKRLARYG